MGALTSTGPGPLRRAVFAWIAMCFAISALGLGARHGCSVLREPLVHHHDAGGKAPTPTAQCDCVGHACCFAPVTPSAPGITIAVAFESTATESWPRSAAPASHAPHLLPYATAPPLLAA